MIKLGYIIEALDMAELDDIGTDSIDFFFDRMEKSLKTAVTDDESAVSGKTKATQKSKMDRGEQLDKLAAVKKFRELAKSNKHDYVKRITEILK